MNLKVERLPHDEGGRNLAFIDPDVLTAAGIEAQSTVELSTKRGRRLLSRAVPRPQDRGLGCVRLDRYQLQSLKPDLYERISLAPVQLEVATRLTLEPMAPLSGNMLTLERELARRFSEEAQLVCGGILLSVKLPEYPRNVLFRVITSDPERAVVGEGTRVTLRTSALMPGVAANLVSFDDVAGLDAQIEQVRELVEWPLRFPQLYEDLGIQAPRGILFYGPPGVGKTYLTRAIANEIGARFLYINGPEIVSSLHGGTEANLRHVFEEAMEHSPSIVMIDELDSIAPNRADSSSQADVRVGSQLLTLLDGLIAMEDVVVIGTTNRVSSLDPALRRPGRLDREVFFAPPDQEGRLEILNVHTRQVPLDEGAIAFLPELARLTHGYVGADLMDLVRRAGLSALRRTVGPEATTLVGAEETAKGIAVAKEDFTTALRDSGPAALRGTLLRIPDVRWDQLGGLDQVVGQLREAVELPLIHSESFRHLHVNPARGVLLYGPPGTGKTMLAKALAYECHANFIPINGPEIFSKWLGESEETVRSVFQLARQVAPTVVFFDQIDAIAPRRRADAANATAERVVNQLLAEMDGIQESAPVIVVAATNRRDLLDTAVLRPGRLGLQIYVGPPDRAGRQRILQILLQGLPMHDDGDWDQAIGQAADETEGLTGADLSALCEQAKLAALREGDYRGLLSLRSSHLLAALDQVKRLRAETDISVLPNGQKLG